ncbi:MAG: nucleotidyltransferase family protein [Candidatus Sumerlaeia bacterium]
MDKRDVIHKLQAHRPELTSRGIESLALFGSLARDEAGSGSDIDLLFEYRRPFGLFEYARAQRFIESILDDSKVDLVSRASLLPEIREKILSEAIRVF